MDENFIDSIFEENNLKLAIVRDNIKKIVDEKKLIRKHLYQSAKIYAQDLNIHANSLFEIAMRSQNNPRNLVNFNFPKMQAPYFSIDEEIAVHTGLLIIAAYSGHATAAKRFINLQSRADYKIDYLSPEDLERMHMAVHIDSQRLIIGVAESYLKYEPGTQKIAEVLISKLREGIARSDPDSFFSMALASIHGRGIDKDIPKAYKLLTIAAGLEHKESIELREKLNFLFPRLGLSIKKTILSENFQLNIKSNLIDLDSVAKSENFLINKNMDKSVIEVINTERVCLVLMKNEPYCTILSVVDGTSEEWLSSLPWPCHLLYQGVFLRANNTTDRCLRLMESDGYPAKLGEPCSAPPHVAMANILIATYQV